MTTRRHQKPKWAESERRQFCGIAFSGTAGFGMICEVKVLKPEGRSNSKRGSVSHTEHDQELIDRVINGDENALAELFSQHRDRLWRMVNFRMDPRLHGRVDADDVLQEAWLSMVQRISHFLSDASRSIFVWFRLITSQTLIDIHRRHLGTQKRNAGMEFSIHKGWSSESTSFSLSFHLLGHLTSQRRPLCEKNFPSS